MQPISIIHGSRAVGCTHWEADGGGGCRGGGGDEGGAYREGGQGTLPTMAAGSRGAQRPCATARS